MNKKLKALQIAALLGVMSSASFVLVAASAPAQAGEKRLHSSSSKTYGLIPLGKKGEERTGNLSKATTTKSASNNGKPSGGDGPQLEDPGLPGYDGGNNGAGGGAGA